MRAFLYYFAHSFVGCIKKLFRSSVAIFVIVMLAFGLIGGLFGGVLGVSLAVFDDSDDEYVDDLLDESIGEDEDDLLFFATEEGRQIGYPILEFGIGGALLLLVCGVLLSGRQKGAQIFTMPDVNFLFTAPVKPQSVLLFREISQLGTLFLFSLYLLLWLPGLATEFGLSNAVLVAMVVAWALSLMLSQLLEQGVYILTASHPNLKKWVFPLIAVLLLTPAVLMGILVWGYHWAVWDAAVWLFASSVSRAIPLWGWIKGGVLFVAEGKILPAILCLAGTLLVMLALLALLWHIQADFYEDALAGATKKQAVLEAQQGKKGTIASRQRKHTERLRTLTFRHANGASAFFFKEMENHFRFARAGFLTGTSGTYLLIGTIVAIFTRLLDSHSMAPAGVVLAFSSFFFTVGNPISHEMQSPYLLTAPEPAAKKLGWSLAAGSVKTLLNLLPALIVSAILLEASPALVVMWLLMLLTMDFEASASGLLSALTLPGNLIEIIRASVQLLLKLLAVVPAVACLMAGVITGHWMLCLALAAGINAVIGAGMFAFCPALLHGGSPT